MSITVIMAVYGVIVPVRRVVILRLIVSVVMIMAVRLYMAMWLYMAVRRCMPVTMSELRHMTMSGLMLMLVGVPTVRMV